MGVSFKTKKNRKKTAKSRHYTPPPDFKYEGHHTHPRTPAKAGLWALQMLEEQENLQITSDVKRRITGISERSQSRVFASGQCRTIDRWPDNGPNPRARDPALTRQDTRAIGRYLLNPKRTMEEKSMPWQDIAVAAGVELPKTKHMTEGEYDSDNYQDVEPQTIQRAVYRDEPIITAIAKEEKALPPWIEKARVDFANLHLGLRADGADGLRPHSKDWRDVVFVDELHEGVGPQNTIHIKRGVGLRDAEENVQYKEWTAKDDREAAKEARFMSMLHVFVAFGYNYRRYIFYEVPNKVGKMTAKAYTEQILPVIAPELKERGLTLFHDADSAHKSKIVREWCARNSLDVIENVGLSPDLSICESQANPLKRAFHKRRSHTREEAAARFVYIMDHLVNEQKIQGMFDCYTARLHAVREIGGKMTKY